MVNLAPKKSVTHFKNIQSGAAIGDEVLSAQSRDVCTGPRITSRRVTQPNGMVSPAWRKIAFMYSLGVTTTRNWSGPGVESFVINEDGHAVLGFDLFNSIPTHRNLFSWVNNRDAFIKDENVGFEKPQIRNESPDSTCQTRHKDFNDSSVKDRLDSQASEKSDQNPSHNQRAGGTKLLGVIHMSSLPQLKVHVDSMQAGVCS